ncbi:hypothetical protein Dimus_035118 [Dionaea muscipula]
MDLWALASFGMVLICRNAFDCWGGLQFGDCGLQYACRLFKGAAFVAGTCVFAFGGALIGGIAGALKGQTTETGFCRGAAIGVISGAIVALELLDSIINGHFLSKFIHCATGPHSNTQLEQADILFELVGLFGSIVSGKAFMEWVSPAVLKAYQWQISMIEGSSNIVSDIYDIDETIGMSPDLVNRLPMICFHRSQIPTSHNAVAVCCPICLQDLEDGESARILAGCEHLFHLRCIDEWLVRCASCPVCRQQLE